MKKFIPLFLVLICIQINSQTTPGKYTVKNVKVNTKYSDFGTAFFGTDKIVFASPREGALITRTVWDYNKQPFLDLFIADVSENQEIINKKKMSGDIDTKYHEGVVSFTKDMKTVYYSANNYVKRKFRKDSTGTNNIQMFKATVNEKGDWTNIKLLPFNGSEFSTGHPALNKDDTKLYFISDRPSSIGKTDIYVVTINSDGTYGKPQNLGPKINTQEREMFPFISDDNILYFSSDGYAGYGGLDVYASKFFKTTMSDPINLESPVNSDKDDFAFIINDTNHQGYFSSNREGGKGDDDIYAFIAFPPLRIEGKQVISGIVVDTKTQQIIPGAVVILQDEEGNEIDRVIITDNTNPDAPIKVGDLNKNNQKNVKVSTGKAAAIKINRTIDNPTPKVGDEVEFTIEVTNNGTKRAKGIKISNILPSGYTYVSDNGKNKYNKDTNTLNIQSLPKGKTITLKVKAKVLPRQQKNGAFSFDANSNKKYKIVVEAPGYLKEEIEVKTVNDTNLAPLEMNISLDQELRVVDEKIMININTIYFDFDKWNIRQDAAKELDKVVAVMKSHPSMIIEAGSHTDSRATESYNQKLSERRAKATVDYLVAKGIDRKRLTARGYGEMQLVNKCSSFVKCTREEHQLNRRTEFVIVNDNKRVPSHNATIENVIPNKESFIIKEQNPIKNNIENNKTSKENQISNTDIETLQIPTIYYDFDKWSISDKEKKQLDKVVQLMKENPTIIVEASAHTDSKNLESYNQLLSEKRAASVVNYIISKGIKPNRIIGKGYGEMQLTNHCKSFVKCTPKEQQANRRTEFKIIKK